MNQIYLYHYFDKKIGPFVNLSDIPVEEAKAVLETIKVTKPNAQSAQRHDKYVEYRHNCEKIIRSEFINKGGLISRLSPHYLTVEHSPWLNTWFENAAHVEAITKAIIKANEAFFICCKLVVNAMDLSLYGWHGDEPFLLVVDPEYPMEWFLEGEPSEAGLLDIHGGRVRDGGDQLSLPGTG